ncbi:hypothetical protein Pmani_021646 [Petrolisthes manimaculis]|uniref:Protein white n=1 Tax=Petrolisthes manimaculis TaxID=1843537 RepID=A0AAE1U590_9EUCA|nr:hypothetical protein Pmani_021646 [Petrolisthes manimaculis]
MSTAYHNPAFEGEPPPYDPENDAKTPEKGVVVVPREQQQQQGGKGQSSEGITYSWQNINVFARTTQGCGRKKTTSEKHILKNVSGLVRPGELLAIMGASGAGKTTLLNVLTFRSDFSLKITGKLHVNGQRVSPEMLTSRSAYVQQDDLFIGTFTVREQLDFQAQLRMDRHLSQKQRMKRVEEVMQELSLTKCANTLIGIPGRIKGISGGETKRLAFACELLTDPPLMFLDEPTSGLDSFMAQSVVQAMKTLANKGMSIISTIHQPSSEVFSLFDRVLLMGEGEVAYLGSTQGALTFFSGLGQTCPKTYNPADFFISTLAIEPEREKECREFVHKACDTFATSSEGHTVQTLLLDNMKAGGANGTSTGAYSKHNKKEKSPYKATWTQQFMAVMKRSFLANIRSPTVLKTKVFQTIVIGLLAGLIYLDQAYDQVGINNINGALFLLLTQTSFSNAFGVVNTGNGY